MDPELRKYLEGMESRIMGGQETLRESLREEMRAGQETLREEMRAGQETLREEMRAGQETLREEMLAGQEDLREGLREEMRSLYETLLKEIRDGDRQTRVLIEFVQRDVRQLAEGLLMLEEKMDRRFDEHDRKWDERWAVVETVLPEHGERITNLEHRVDILELQPQDD